MTRRRQVGPFRRARDHVAYAAEVNANAEVRARMAAVVPQALVCPWCHGEHEPKDCEAITDTLKTPKEQM